MGLLADIVSWPLILAGSAFYLIGTFGLLRMPDVFTRMHAHSVSDTLGAGLLIVGMIVQSGFSLVTAKLLFILIILFFTGPVASHAISRAARFAGVEPQLHEPQRHEGAEDKS